jgi:MATE family multidrug resistance protein
MSPVRVEISTLARLAGPAIATQLGMQMLGVVDALMLGRVGAEALGAAAIGNVWTGFALFCSMGILLGIDPIVSQAHGAGDGRSAALALQRGIVLALALSLPIAAAFALTESVLLLAGQQPSLARAAHRYVLAQAPSIPCFLAFVALRQYLQGRTIVRPAMWALVVANAVNVVACWALIFGNLGAPALGVLGAGIATAIARGAQLLTLVGLVWLARLHEGAWVPWSRAAFDPAGLRRILRLGLPIWMHLAFEISAFSSSTLLAGFLGVDALAGHTVALNLASLSFMVPLGLAMAASTRVGNLIGERDAAGVTRATHVAFAATVGLMFGWAALFIGAPRLLASLYTGEAGVIAVCAVLVPIAGAFQLLDGLQVVASGILRGMGRTRPPALSNFVGYWLLGLPLGAWLAFSAGFGIAGVWWGLSAGLLVVATWLTLLALRSSAPLPLAAVEPAAPPTRVRVANEAP